MVDGGERHRDHRGVVDVGIPRVLELERPPAGLPGAVLHRPVPVARDDLLVEQPRRGADQSRVVAAHAGVGQRADREPGVPDRRDARLHAVRAAGGDREAVDGSEPAHDDRIGRVVPDRAQPEQRVEHGGDDPAPIAGVLLVLDRPLLGKGEPARAKRCEAGALGPLQHGVGAVEEVLDGVVPARQRKARVVAAFGVQLVEIEHRTVDGLAVEQQDQRDGAAACPAREIVDRERTALREDHQPRRERRQPGPLVRADEREVHLGEDPRASDPAAFEDECSRAPQRGIAGSHAEHAQRHVRLDAYAEIAPVAVGELPAAVLALFLAEVPLRGRARHAFERPPDVVQQQHLGRNRDV